VVLHSVSLCLWSHQLCDVQQLCWCPAAAGSRSSPLALAAAQHPRAQVTCCIDERSLAFWALGYGRATGCGRNFELQRTSCCNAAVQPRRHRAGLGVCHAKLTPALG
jgi:hypothetical protein